MSRDFAPLPDRLRKRPRPARRVAAVAGAGARVARCGAGAEDSCRDRGEAERRRRIAFIVRADPSRSIGALPADEQAQLGPPAQGPPRRSRSAWRIGRLDWPKLVPRRRGAGSVPCTLYGLASPRLDSPTAAFRVRIEPSGKPAPGERAHECGLARTFTCARGREDCSPGDHADGEACPAKPCWRSSSHYAERPSCAAGSIPILRVFRTLTAALPLRPRARISPDVGRRSAPTSFRCRDFSVKSRARDHDHRPLVLGLKNVLRPLHRPSRRPGTPAAGVVLPCAVIPCPRCINATTTGSMPRHHSAARHAFRRGAARLRRCALGCDPADFIGWASPARHGDGAGREI